MNKKVLDLNVIQWPDAWPVRDFQCVILDGVRYYPEKPKCEKVKLNAPIEVSFLPNEDGVNFSPRIEMRLETVRNLPINIIYGDEPGKLNLENWGYDDWFSMYRGQIDELIACLRFIKNNSGEFNTDC